MKRIRRIKLIGILGLIAINLMLVGCERSQKSMTTLAPAEVSVIIVQPEQIILTTELPGRTSAYLVAEIRPQVSGIIQKRLFTEGSNVKAGQVLYQIDPAPFQAALDNAKAALGRAEANLPAIRSRAERFRELIADKAVSQQDYDDAVAALKQAEADVEYWKAAVKSAKINLEYTRVLAPISGRIGKSNVTEGALVTAHQPLPLATIQQLNPIYVDIPQSTAELLRLQRRLEEGRLKHEAKDQNKVKLILEDNTKYPLEGTLQFRDVTVDPTTGSVVLRAIFPNPENVLLPGMFVRAIVKEGINKKAIMVPQQTVFRDTKGNPFVYIVDKESKVQIRPIIIDRAIEDKWLVSEGLSAGEQVIMEGVQKVMPGMPVKTVPYVTQQKPERPGS
ncbi:MAG: efflux RND transporter periplasmic adaptor subunit [Thermodesulfovibrionales bacterium]